MIIKESFNAEDIKDVLCHPAIYDTISSDNSGPSSEFEPPVGGDDSFIVGYVEGVPMAVMVYHKYKGGKACHVQVLPEYRKEYAKEFTQESLGFRGKETLYARIPDLYKNVINFALLNDFEIIGKEDANYIKNGVKYLTSILKYRG